MSSSRGQTPASDPSRWEANGLDLLLLRSLLDVRSELPEVEEHEPPKAVEARPKTAPLRRRSSRPQRLSELVSRSSVQPVVEAPQWTWPRAPPNRGTRP